MFLKLLVKTEFLTKNHEFLKTSILPFGYPGFQKKKHFSNELILKPRVKVNMQPLSPPTLFLVTTNFRGIPVLSHVLEKSKETNG